MTRAQASTKLTNLVVQAAVLCVTLVLSTGCGGQPDHRAVPSTARASHEEGAAPRTSQSAPPTAAKVTRCADVRLPSDGVGEADFTVNAAAGVLDIHFSDTRHGEYQNVSYRVRYLKDPSCLGTPKMAELIGRINPPGWFPTANQCQILGPDELPDGSPPGAARPYRNGHPGHFMNAWGTGSQQVVIGRGQEVLVHTGDQRPGFPRTGGEPVVGQDGVRRWVLAIGDPPSGQITYSYVLHGCPYVMWTQPGLTWTDALAYASRPASTTDKSAR